MPKSKKQIKHGSPEPFDQKKFEKWILSPADTKVRDKIKDSLKLCADPKKAYGTEQNARTMLINWIISILIKGDDRWKYLVCSDKKEDTKKFHTVVNQVELHLRATSFPNLPFTYPSP